MQRSFIGTEAGRVHHHHRLAARPVRAASRSAGFFTIGIALAVLAGGALFAGSTGALNVTESASAPAPSVADAGRVPPGDRAGADGARNVVVSEAPARSSSAPGGAAGPLQ